MVQLTILVRRKPGYSRPNQIQRLTVDSSQRLEEIVEQGNLLFTQEGRELPLNSSFASNNVQNDDILESCSSPLMSSLLSSVLQDLNSIEKLDEDQRTQERVQPLLEGVDLDPWPDVGRWSNDKLKPRKICLAMIKKTLQRDDRYANTQVPPLTSLNELHQFMQTQPQFNSSGGFNSMAHMFKPSAKNRNGQPTVTWEMTQQKFNKAKLSRMNKILSKPLSSNNTPDIIKQRHHLPLLVEPNDGLHLPKIQPANDVESYLLLLLSRTDNVKHVLPTSPILPVSTRGVSFSNNSLVKYVLYPTIPETYVIMIVCH